MRYYWIILFVVFAFSTALAETLGLTTEPDTAITMSAGDRTCLTRVVATEDIADIDSIIFWASDGWTVEYVAGCVYNNDNGNGEAYQPVDSVLVGDSTGGGNAKTQYRQALSGNASFSSGDTIWIGFYGSDNIRKWEDSTASSIPWEVANDRFPTTWPESPADNATADVGVYIYYTTAGGGEDAPKFVPIKK